jgi:dolichol-phosphate mannosyltransferase
VRNWVTHDGVIDTGCSLKAFKSELAGDLPPLRGVHRFMPAWFRMHGRTIEQMCVNHRARERGQSKYTNLKRLPETILDLFGFWWFRRRYIRLPGNRP